MKHTFIIVITVLGNGPEGSSEMKVSMFMHAEDSISIQIHAALMQCSVTQCVLANLSMGKK